MFNFEIIFEENSFKKLQFHSILLRTNVCNMYIDIYYRS